MANNTEELDEDAKRELRKIILENKKLGGSSWKVYTSEELKGLGLSYLIEEQTNGE